LVILYRFLFKYPTTGNLAPPFISLKIEYFFASNGEANPPPNIHLIGIPILETPPPHVESPRRPAARPDARNYGRYYDKKLTAIGMEALLQVRSACVSHARPPRD